LISKLSDSEGEAAETQVWLSFAVSFGYLDKNMIQELDEKHDVLERQIIKMIQNPEEWTT
jgi:four helix bundle protein